MLTRFAFDLAFRPILKVCIIFLRTKFTLHADMPKVLENEHFFLNYASSSENFKIPT